MTKAPVNASAIRGEEKTYWKPTRYIWVGSSALPNGMKCSMARNARNEPAKELEHAGNDPAGSGQQIGRPPSRRAVLAAGGQEPEKVDLLADLRDQREHDRRGGAEQNEVERSSLGTGEPRKVRPALERGTVRERDVDERNEVQHDPDRLRPQLEAADERDAVGDQRNNDQGAEHIAEQQRNPQAHLERERHDGRFDREEQEGEGGVDQRGDRRADIAEAGGAREQVDIDPVGGGVVGNRHAGQEDQRPDHQDGARRIGEAVIDGDRAADCFQRQERTAPMAVLATRRLDHLRAVLAVKRSA